MLADRGLRVIVTGLDLDFRGEPFGPMPLLMAEAELVDKLHAICVVCGAPASRTQRLINGQPANYRRSGHPGGRERGVRGALPELPQGAGATAGVTG